MKVTAIVPNLRVENVNATRDFLIEFLGLRMGFDHRGVVNLRSRDNPLAQVQLFPADGPAISVHVPDAQEAYEVAKAHDYDIAYPLTHEPDGRVRFFVRAPGGILINIIEHDDSAHLP
jgi:catechol 2,3-dioxygenase-like lactoylglutathione lyase family enzyme